MLLASVIVVSSIALHMATLGPDDLLKWAIVGWILSCFFLVCCFVTNEMWVRLMMKMNEDTHKRVNDLILGTHKESIKEMVQ